MICYVTSPPEMIIVEIPICASQHLKRDHTLNIKANLEAEGNLGGGGWRNGIESAGSSGGSQVLPLVDDSARRI